MTPLLPQHDRERSTCSPTLPSPFGCQHPSAAAEQQQQRQQRQPQQQRRQRQLLWVPSKSHSATAFSPSLLHSLCELFSNSSPFSSSAVARHFAQRGLAALALFEIAAGLLAVSAAFGLLVYQSLTDGPQQLLLFALLRFAFLLLAGVLTYRAFGKQQQQQGPCPSSAPGRASLCRAALLAQLLWFASELLLGSALLAFYPVLGGPRPGLGALTGPAFRGTPAFYLLAMTGCLGFLSHLGRRRSSSGGGHGRSDAPAGAIAPSGCFGFSCGGGDGFTVTACRLPSTDGGSGSGGSHLSGSSAGSRCSPAGSEASAGSFSSGSSALFYPDASGLNSPTGPLAGTPGASCDGGPRGHATCSIVLVEHEVSGSPDGRGLFVHKPGLRPIRTRPDDGSARPYVPLLKPIISNSFSCDSGAAASIRGALGVVASGGSFSTAGGGSVASVQHSGSSFQFATTASLPIPLHRHAI